MQKNLISAIAGWKSAALLALVAMVAAVAFSGVLTNSADAAGPGDTATVTTGTGNGETAISLVPFTSGGSDAVATFTITGGTASGSFAANGGQALVCSNDDACDSEKDTTTNVITVAINIDEDSPNGFILVSVADANSTGAGNRRVNVTTADRVASLSARPATPSPAIDADADNTQAANQVVITATAQNSVEGGVNGKPVIIYTTLGLLDGCDVVAADGSVTSTTNNVQACTENTRATDLNADGDTEDAGEAGVVQVTLKATGRAGVATVNFTQGTFTAAVDVVFYGAAASITAEADESSIEIGGSTYIVVTVLDSGGNPVANHEIATRPQTAAGGDADNDGVVGPGAKAVEVDVNVNRDKDAGPPAGTLRVVDTKLGDLPACGDQTAVAQAGAGIEADTNLVTDINDAANTDVGAGTNAAGQCAIHVSAPFSDDGNPANDATRGTNTVNIAGPGATATDTSKDVAVAISVGGPPAEISTDAPSRVDALSSTTVTVTVVDDEGVLVGTVDSSVTQVEGDGALIAGAGMGETTDGVTSFTYLAPSRSGTAVFRVTAGSGAGTISHNVVIDIGPEPEPEPEPEPAPVLTWSAPIVSGWNQVVWQGEDGASVADNVGDGVTSVHQWNVGSQRFSSWFAGAEGVPTTVNDFSELENGGIYWVYSE